MIALEICKSKVCPDAIKHAPNNEPMTKTDMVYHQIKRNETTWDVRIHIDPG
jgi:hypothetical protein